MSLHHRPEAIKPIVEMREFLGQDPPYAVEMNHWRIGDLMRSLGLSDQAIANYHVRIDPMILQNPISGRYRYGSFSPDNQEIRLFPTQRWNDIQGLLALAQARIEGSSVIQQARTFDHFALVVDRQEIQVPKEAQKATREQGFELAKGLLGKKLAGKFTQMVDDENLERAEELLLEYTNRKLRQTLVHEIIHATNSKLYDGIGLFIDGLLLKVAPIALPFAAVLATRFIPGVHTNTMVDAAVAANAVLVTSYLTRSSVSRLAYLLNPNEIRAFHLSKRIVDDPKWQDIIKTGVGWDNNYDFVTSPIQTVYYFN